MEETEGEAISIVKKNKKKNVEANSAKHKFSFQMNISLELGEKIDWH